MFKIDVCMPAFAAKYKLIVINHSCKSKLRCKKVSYHSKRIYRVVARKAENLSNCYLFLERITFTKFFEGVCYIILIDVQNVVRALQSNVVT